MKTQISNYIRAGYPAVYLITPEEVRAEAEIKGSASDLNFALHFWSTTNGLVDASTGATNNALDPLECLNAIGELKEKTIIVLRDFHLFLNDPNPILLRTFKDLLKHLKTANKTVIILSCRLCLPPELEREITVVEFTLPTDAELGVVLDGIIESAAIKPLAADARENAINAAKGMTTIEAENAFALSVVETKAITPSIIAREKSQAIKKAGLLEVVELRRSLDMVGGLDVLKSWLVKRRHCFSQRARDYKLPTPSGLLILGVSGTGKSETAKATAEVFQCPLLRLDAGKLFAGLVGQSESNLRSAIQQAEAIAPCTLWIDELEKSFSGVKSSGSSDGGTTARVFGTFLNWMQEKTAPVFVVATANDVQQLPPELLRRGRFDEIFFVDLPNEIEREAIWKIVIRSYSRDPKDFDVKQLAKATEGLTGAEIRAVFFDALFTAFEADDEPTDLDIAQELNGFVPLSKLMAEQINGLRQWAKGRAKLATSAATSTPKARKLAA